MKADEYLLKAAALLAQRGEDYDKPQGERSVPGAVAAFNAITGRDLTDDEGWLILVCLKLHRQYQATGNHPDSIEDAGAYWALWAESLDEAAAPPHAQLGDIMLGNPLGAIPNETLRKLRDTVVSPPDIVTRIPRRPFMPTEQAGAEGAQE